MQVFTPPALYPYSLFTDDSGYPIHAFFVDYRHPDNRHPITTLIKRCEKKFAFEHCGTICISTPEKYRKFGEVLIRDPYEGKPTRITKESEVVDDPDDLKRVQARHDEFNRMARLAGSGIRRVTRSVITQCEQIESISLGNFGWIYCASIAPEGQDEARKWEHSFRETNYDHSSYIYRPLEFLHALGAMVVEQLGPQISNTRSEFTLADQSTVESESKGQILFHGPVIYVDDPYEVVSNAVGRHDRLYLPYLVKSAEFKDQREYRFVILTDDEPTENDRILTVSPAMNGATRERPKPNLTHTESQYESVPPIDADESDSPASVYSCARHESQTEPPIFDNLIRHFTEAISDPESPISVSPSLDSPKSQEDAAEAITTVSSLKALRNRVSNLLSGAPRIELAAAAYHAEPYLLALCKEFDNPIDSIAVKDRDFIVVNINLAADSEVTVKLIFGPSGNISLGTKGSNEQTFSIWDNKGWIDTQSIIESLEKVGLSRRRATQ